MNGEDDGTVDVVIVDGALTFPDRYCPFCQATVVITMHADASATIAHDLPVCAWFVEYELSDLDRLEEP